MIIIPFIKPYCKSYLANIFHYFISLYATEEKIMKNTARLNAPPFLLALFGLIAGIVNGLLGAGSGILITYALRAVSPALRRDSRDLLANATAIILPISLISAVSYLRAGILPSSADCVVYLLPGIVGGIVGGLLLGKLPEQAIRRLFATVVLISGMIMLFR